MTLTTFEHNVPLGLIELAIEEGRKRLPLLDGPQGGSRG
jgi:hypothetical protein